MKKVYRKLRLIAALIFFLISFVLFCYLSFVIFYQGKFFPGVKIAGMDASGQTLTSIKENLNPQYNNRKNTSLNLSYQTQTFPIDFSSASPDINLDDTLNQAYLTGRSGNALQDISNQFKLLVVGQDFVPVVKFKNKSQLLSQINLIDQQIRKEAVSAQLIFTPQINVTPSQNGIALDNTALLNSLQNYLSLAQNKPEIIPTKILVPDLTTAVAEKYKKVLEKAQISPIRLYFENNNWLLDQPTLYSLLDFNGTKDQLASLQTDGQIFVIESINLGQESLTDQELLLDNNKLTTYLNNLSLKINQPLKESKFIFDETSGRVTEFEPGQAGRALNIEKSVSLISKAVTDGTTADIQLPVEQTFPKTSASKINNFGIKELLGAGTSSFVDSIPNRVFNIGLASSRINGILVPPGETFSFDAYLGEVTAGTGYKQAYVIKEGKTVLDDGGGVCQVSTTLFRAALNAGLPIVERTAHAYRVGFYEQGGSPPGIDATVYPPSVDFKFKNDTGSYILIQNSMVGTTLIYQIYGTSDGRVTTIGKPVILSQTPPPPDLRQDDPTMPKGTEREAEHSIWGMNTQFKRTVIRNGETLIDEIIRSNFRPWQKVTLVGTKE